MTLDAIEAKTPFLSQSLPARLDAWGEPMQRDNAVGPDAYTPVKVSPIKSDPVSAEVSRIVAFPTAPDHSFKVDGVPIQLNPQQYGEFVQLSRQPAKADIAKAMSSPVSKQLPDSIRRQAVKEILDGWHDNAKLEILHRHPELVPRE